jgi:hypothetical protein
MSRPSPVATAAAPTIREKLITSTYADAMRAMRDLEGRETIFIEGELHLLGKDSLAKVQTRLLDISANIHAIADKPDNLDVKFAEALAFLGRRFCWSGPSGELLISPYTAEYLDALEKQTGVWLWPFDVPEARA